MQVAPALAEKASRFKKDKNPSKSRFAGFFRFQRLISYFALLKFLNQIFPLDVANL